MAGHPRQLRNSWISRGGCFEGEKMTFSYLFHSFDHPSWRYRIWYYRDHDENVEFSLN